MAYRLCSSPNIEPLRMVLRSLRAPIELRKCCRDIAARTRDPSLGPWSRKERALIRKRQMHVLDRGEERQPWLY
jgi:hypothetical protein